MTAPQQALVAFALWTIVVPLGAIATYRWGRILRGIEPIHAFRADRADGADWYRRAMRAHANCVENLPVMTAVVLALSWTAVRSPTADFIAWLVFAARVVQSTVHIGFSESRGTVSARFTFFLVQLIGMFVMIACVEW